MKKEKQQSFQIVGHFSIDRRTFAKILLFYKKNGCVRMSDAINRILKMWSKDYLKKEERQRITRKYGPAYKAAANTELELALEMAKLFPNTNSLL